MEPKNNQNDEKRKELYESPELTIHGDVDELTQQVAGGDFDGELGENSPALF